MITGAIVLSFLKRFWVHIACIILGLSLVVFFFAGVSKHRERVEAAYKIAYDKGYADAVSKIKADLEKEAREQEKQILEASADYQEKKSEMEQKERVRYVTVQKIVEKPVYRNVCVDDDGLRELNEAINAR